MALLIFFLLLALGVSFLCSVLEACLLSIPPSYVRMSKARGTRTGKRLFRLKEGIDRPLAAILSLNTIAHTVGAAGVGAQAATVFGQAYFGIISAVLTVLILFLSEIIPKTLGAVYWKRLAGFTAVTCEVIIVVLLPLVWISEKLTNFFKPEGKLGTIANRDELVTLAHLSFKEGVIAENESSIIRNLLRFRSIRVEDIATPRTVAAKVPGAMTCGEAIEQKSVIRFSRILVHSEDYDDYSGYVLKQRILEEVAFDRHSTRISDIQCPIRTVSGQGSLSYLFQDLFDHHDHIALVVDEYGAMSGLVTIEDLIETLLGLEIVDESDPVVDMREFARKNWRERASRMGIELSEDAPEA